MAFILSLAAVKLIEAQVDKLFDRASARFLGPQAFPKYILGTFRTQTSLPGIFMAAAREEGAVPDKAVIDRLTRNAKNYLDSYRAKSKAQVVQEVQSFLNEAATKGVATDVETVLGGKLADVWASTTSDVKRLIDTESTVARNMGTLEGIIAANTSEGVEDPVVFFVVVRDRYLCRECMKLHMLDDETTPRVWRLSEIGHGYHKRGQKEPKVGGLHPNCRCTMVTLMPGYGFGADGMVKHIGEGHDEYDRQRHLGKAEPYQPHDCAACRHETSTRDQTYKQIGVADSSELPENGALEKADAGRPAKTKQRAPRKKESPASAPPAPPAPAPAAPPPPPPPPAPAKAPQIAAFRGPDGKPILPTNIFEEIALSDVQQGGFEAAEAKLKHYRDYKVGNPVAFESFLNRLRSAEQYSVPAPPPKPTPIELLQQSANSKTMPEVGFLLPNGGKVNIGEWEHHHFITSKGFRSLKHAFDEGVIRTRIGKFGDLNLELSSRPSDAQMRELARALKNGRGVYADIHMPDGTKQQVSVDGPNARAVDLARAFDKLGL